jgi:hypothetical protein
MRTEYRINDQLLEIGSTIECANYGTCRVLIIGADHIRVEKACGAERTVFACEMATEIPLLTTIRTAEVGYFHRITGKPIRAGDTLAGGTVEGVYDDVLRFDQIASEPYHRFIEIDPSVESHAAGVEIRIHPTSEEIANGLPRTEVDGRMWVTCGNVQVPVEETVWLDGAYRLISKCKLMAGWETRYVLDTSGMRQLTDGRYALEDECVQITYGRRRGEIVYLGDAVATEDGCVVPTDEAISYLSESGVPRWLSHLPDGCVELDGHWVRDRDLRECSRTGATIHCSQVTLLENGDVVSADWARTHCRQCDECGVYFEPSNERDCECPRCRRNARTRIRNYSNRSASGFSSEEDIPIKFGIELEVGCDRGYDRSVCTGVMADAVDSAGVKIEHYAVFKEDGSLSECNGFEVVTRPDSPAVHKRIWEKALSSPEVTRHMTSFNNGRCGIHIHVSREPLSDLWVGRLLVLVNSPANRPLIFKIAGRGSGNYTQYYEKKLTDGRRYRGERYESINTTSDLTIEFRMFRGTLRRESFLKNIEFVEAALAFTRPASRSIREMDTPDAFLDFVSKSRKTYPHLFGFLTARDLFTR